MRRYPRRPGLAVAPVALAIVALALVPLGSSAAAVPVHKIHYASRLHLPTRGDAFRQPKAVVSDLHTGETFVADTLGQRIVIFDEQGLFRYEINGGTVFRAPLDLAIDPEGFLIVLASHRGRRGPILLDFDGQFVATIDLVGFPDGMASPVFSSLALSPGGDRLYLVDTANKRLWISDRKGHVQRSADLSVGLTEKEAEEMVLGHVDVYGETVLVSIPTVGRVYLYDLDGEPKGEVGLRGTAFCQTAFPFAAALTDEGFVVILDKQRALYTIWDPLANRCLSEHSGFGDAPGLLYQPADMALDRTGRIYISQGLEGRVQVFEGADPAAYPRTDGKSPARMP